MLSRALKFGELAPLRLLTESMGNKSLRISRINNMLLSYKNESSNDKLS
jgi:hypothetical protein